MGSSGWLSVTASLDDDRLASQLPSAIPGLGYEFCTDSVGTTIEYLIREFYRDVSDNKDIHALIEEEVRSIEDDEQEVLFFLIFGEEARSTIPMCVQHS